MWDAIKKMLTGDEADGAAAADLDEARVCATALLVEAALADGIYADIEESLIRTIVCETFKVSDGDCHAIVDQAEARAEEAVDHHRFTKKVKALPLEEREGLVEALWRVVFADGEESPFEEAFVRKVSALVAVDDRVSREARKRAQAGQTDPGGAEPR